MAEEKQEVREEEKAVESRPLEVPEVVPGAAPTDFPEVGDYLKNMRIKSGLFGFRKEDVYVKMQGLNLMYQSRTQQMREQARGQIKQIKKQHQEDLQEAREKAEKALEEFKTTTAGEVEELRAELEKEREEIRLKSRAEIEEARRQLEEERQSELEQRRRELALIGEELERLMERMNLLKDKVTEMGREG